MTALQDRLLEAHAKDDRGELVSLYTEAADKAQNTDAACFYLTHAYIFALETGDEAATPLFSRLKAHGRI